jgi:uncharacterized damage-inducible protein DinB
MENKDLFVQMALGAWNTQISRADKYFGALSDEDFNKQVAPGKNSIKYLIGHLIAVNDGMISLYGLGNRSYAHFDEAFIKNPDRSNLQMPDAAELKEHWKKSNQELSGYFNNMSADDWFSRHTAMTDEDHIKEPGRNKLSVLLNRTSHIAYHLGQLMLAR